jgi:triosephosphate isomerase
MLIVNFKNYKSSKENLILAKKILKIVPNSIVCPPVVDLNLISSVKGKVFSQNVNSCNSLQCTGKIVVNKLKSMKIKGSLINHSENPVSVKEIKKIVKELNKNNLKAIVCTGDLKKINEIKKLKPYAIAYEISELIGTKKSIVKYEENKVKKFVELLRKTKIKKICGAGISSLEDIDKAYELGCDGILVSSWIVNNKKIDSLLNSIKKRIK